MRRLEVVPIYLSEHGQIVERLGPVLEQALQASVSRRTAWFDPEACFDPSRGQYNSTQLLRSLLEHTRLRHLRQMATDRIAALDSADGTTAGAMAKKQDDART